MLFYWVLSFPKNQLIFRISKFLVLGSNLLFMSTLAIRWITQGYFPLSNLYESLIFLLGSLIHLVIESRQKSSYWSYIYSFNVLLSDFLV
jgi:ABC-type transport system involved in cytochrome c biogenesis permease subunit